MTDVAPCGCLAAKFDSCNSLLSSVHTLLVNILRCVRWYIKRKYLKKRLLLDVFKTFYFLTKRHVLRFFGLLIHILILLIQRPATVSCNQSVGWSVLLTVVG